MARMVGKPDHNLRLVPGASTFGPRERTPLSLANAQRSAIFAQKQPHYARNLR